MVTKVANGLDLLLQRIVNLGDPTVGTDAATKQYVDNLVRGLDWKQSVRATTTGNVATLSGTMTLDGVSLAVGDRVLLKNQTDATQNGIYVVATGSWSRAQDFSDSTSVTASAAVTVEEGSTWKDTVWMLTTDGTVTIGTSNLVFSQLGGGISYTAGQGISISGTTISVVGSYQGGITTDAGGVRVDRTKVPFRFSAAIPAGTSPVTVNHLLNQLDVAVTLLDVTGTYPKGAIPDFDVLDAANVRLYFATSPVANQWRVVVMG